MGCFWNVEGNIVASLEQEAQIDSILTSFGLECDIEKRTEEDVITYDVNFIGEASYGFSDELAETLAKVALKGELECVEDDEDYSRCRFNSGQVKWQHGQILIYYPRSEVEFINSLPKSLKQRITAMIMDY